MAGSWIKPLNFRFQFALPPMAKLYYNWNWRLVSKYLKNSFAIFFRFTLAGSWIKPLNFRLVVDWSSSLPCHQRLNFIIIETEDGWVLINFESFLLKEKLIFKNKFAIFSRFTLAGAGFEWLNFRFVVHWSSSLPCRHWLNFIIVETEDRWKADSWYYWVFKGKNSLKLTFFSFFFFLN